ncbi:MAG: hypothetical protein POH28_05200 [Acidocella sp.]|nr:hypothetical protein [Acidocella sp.]
MNALSPSRKIRAQPVRGMISKGKDWATLAARLGCGVAAQDNLPQRDHKKYFQVNQMVSLRRDLFFGKHLVLRGSVGIVITPHRNSRLFDIKFFSEEIITLTISHLDLAPVL